MIDTIEPGINRMVEMSTAQHYVNATTHAASMIRQLQGELTPLFRSKEDDPLLFACQILDRVGRMAGLLIAIEKWAHAVHEATPDQIEETGAQLCRTKT